ncbi:MAG: VTT domain-containing protein [Chloroflexota bacterium]|nr:VTT domain-containing protein [Chloroflexota bacterium]
MDERPTQTPAGTSREWIRQAVALILVVIITVTIFYLTDEIQRFRAYGYPGVFVISLLGNATVILPAPSLAVVFAMGSVLHPLLVGMCAGPGEALGELTGYMAGYGGRAAIENREMYDRLESRMRRYGGLTVFVLSVIPNPVFDLAGIAAGVLRYPLWRFLLFCWLGKTIKTVAFAYAGAYSVSFMERFL